MKQYVAREAGSLRKIVKPLSKYNSFSKGTIDRNDDIDLYIGTAIEFPINAKNWKKPKEIIRIIWYFTSFSTSSIFITLVKQK